MIDAAYERPHFAFFDSVADAPAEIAADSIVSRTLHHRDGLRVIVFGFAPGQELSEHTSSKRALLYFVEGEAVLTLGDRTMQAGPGSLAVMDPHLPHSIRAVTQTRMVLIMVDAA